MLIRPNSRTTRRSWGWEGQAPCADFVHRASSFYKLNRTIHQFSRLASVTWPSDFCMFVSDPRTSLNSFIIGVSVIVDKRFPGILLFVNRICLPILGPAIHLFA